MVDEVVRGIRPHAVINEKFGSTTGIEVFLPRASAEPFLRDTYAVRVIILRDRLAKKGYRVQSAFPTSE